MYEAESLLIVCVCLCVFESVRSLLWIAALKTTQNLVGEKRNFNVKEPRWELVLKQE